MARKTKNADAGEALREDAPGVLKAEDVSGALEEYIRVTGQRMEMRSIDSVIPYVRNARIHDAAQIAYLRGSLRTFGFVKPITIDEQGNLIAGHGILEAARAEGMTEVPCVVASGLSEVERQAYILADNALAEMSAWDEKMRGLEVKRLSSLGVNTGLLGLKTDKLSPVDVEAYTRAAPGQGEGETVDFEPFDGAGDGGGSQIQNGTKFRVVLGPLIFDLEDGNHSLYQLAKAASLERVTFLAPKVLRQLMEDAEP